MSSGVFQKTESGKAEIARRQAGLSPATRTVLVMVNGSDAVSALMARGLPQLQGHLDVLLALGLIEPVVARAAPAPKRSIKRDLDGLGLARIHVVKHGTARGGAVAGDGADHDLMGDHDRDGVARQGGKGAVEQGQGGRAGLWVAEEGVEAGIEADGAEGQEIGGVLVAGFVSDIDRSTRKLAKRGKPIRDGLRHVFLSREIHRECRQVRVLRRRLQCAFGEARQRHRAHCVGTLPVLLARRRLEERAAVRALLRRQGGPQAGQQSQGQRGDPARGQRRRDRRRPASTHGGATAKGATRAARLTGQ